MGKNSEFVISDLVYWIKENNVMLNYIVIVMRLHKYALKEVNVII
jgi:hypothetical protein